MDNLQREPDILAMWQRYLREFGDDAALVLAAQLRTAWYANSDDAAIVATAIDGYALAYIYADLRRRLDPGVASHVQSINDRVAYFLAAIYSARAAAAPIDDPGQ